MELILPNKKYLNDYIKAFEEFEEINESRYHFNNAKEICGKEYTVAEIADECVRSKMMFFSGGGVTFTGGEATLQHEELLEALKILKKKG